MARIQIEPPEPVIHTTEVGVRISDMNYGAHMGHDALISLIHESRARFFRDNDMDELDVDGLGIIVADLGVQYRAEAFFGDQLRFETGLRDFSKKGCDIVTRVSKDAGQVEVARAKVGIVFFDYAARKPAPVPERFRALATP